MRIGIDCRLWNESGVGRYIRNLVEQLLIIDKRNQYVLFVLLKNEKEIAHFVQNDKEKVQNERFKIVVADIYWHTIEEQLRFPSVLNKENLDLVHFPYISVPIFYSKPFIVTIHDLIPYHFPTGEASTLPIPLYQLKQLGYKFITSRAAKRAKKIIAVSNVTKADIVDRLRVEGDKIMVTYEGVTTSSKFKVQSSKLQPKIKNYFLYVGNAYPHKNLDRLIQGIALLCHPENDTKLVLVGKEDYFYRRLKEKVKDMGLERSILFYGEATDEELSVLYKNAIALVMPSIMEGFGLPLLEAMVNKCLVLASDIPSLKEICEDAAIYFDPYNTKDLVRKMCVILVSEAYPESLRALGDAGQASMTKRNKIEKGFKRAKMFSWKEMAEETLRLYENCFYR